MSYLLSVNGERNDYKTTDYRLLGREWLIADC